MTRAEPASSMWRLAAPVVGALAWIVVVGARLRSVNERWWITRDDGVITLSHARNLADFGSIGVSPGGDRVEGFSSPLHFAGAYVVQLVSDAGYRSTSIVLLAIGLALAGAAVGWGVASTCAAGGAGDRLRPAALAGAAAAAGTALAVAASWTAVGWLGSGMENPLVVAAGTAVIAAGFAAPGRARTVVLVVALSALAISRVEFAAFVVPAAVAAATVVAADGHRRGPIETRTFAVVAGVPLGVAALVHLSRRWYFGDWLPNTALVQERETGTSQVALIAAVTVLLLALQVRSAAARWPARRAVIEPVAAVVAVVAGAGILWSVSTGRTAGRLEQLLVLPALLPLGALVACLAIALRAVGGRLGPADHLALAVVAVPLAQYVATGPARLDEFRVAGMVAPFLVVWIASLLVRLAVATAGLAGAHRWTRSIRAAVVAVAVVAVAVPVGWVASNDGARALNYEIAWADDLAAVARDVRDERLGGAGQVILANPDLGKVSFDKSAVMVDLGLLGDPLLARLATDRPDLVDRYLGSVAVPDVVSTHSGWSCEFRGWIESDGFVERYRLLGDDEPWRRPEPVCPLDGRRAVWVRADGEAEYELARALLADGADVVDLLDRAVAECVADSGEPMRCQPVRRAVQRAADGLRSDGSFGAAVEALAASPSYDLDRELLHRSAGWAERAVDALERLVG